MRDEGAEPEGSRGDGNCEKRREGADHLLCTFREQYNSLSCILFFFFFFFFFDNPATSLLIAERERERNVKAKMGE